MAATWQKHLYSLIDLAGKRHLVGTLIFKMCFYNWLYLDFYKGSSGIWWSHFSFHLEKEVLEKQLPIEPWATEVNLCWCMCQLKPVKLFWILKGRWAHLTFVHNENYHLTFYNISYSKLFNILKLKIINKADGTTCSSWTLADNAPKRNNVPPSWNLWNLPAVMNRSCGHDC